MQVLGSYSLVSAVGTGSTGTVWRAVHTDLGRIVAVKVLSPGVSQELLRGEARVLASLDHPNVVRVYDFVEAGAGAPDDPAWLAEEWVEGERLDELVARVDRKLTAEQGLGVVRGALLGLAHAHERGVVHGDVAAGNVLIDTAGASKLIDFGLASPIASSSASGTPAFVSPEAAQGLPVTPASDVYSAAALLYYLLAGRPPFGSSGTDALLKRHISEPPPRLADHGNHIAGVLTRAMAKQPVERPQNASALLAELEDAAQERYGAGWLGRASVAGLAASPAIAVAAAEADTGSTTAAAAAAAPTAAAITVAESSDADRLSAARSWKVPTIGVAIAAIIAGVVVAITASGATSKAAPAAAGAPASAAPRGSKSLNPAAPASATPAVGPSPSTASQPITISGTLTTTLPCRNVEISTARGTFQILTAASLGGKLTMRTVLSGASGQAVVAAKSGIADSSENDKDPADWGPAKYPLGTAVHLTGNFERTFRAAFDGCPAGIEFVFSKVN